MSTFSHDDLLLAERAIHSARRKNEKVLQTLQKKAVPNRGLILRTERQLVHLERMQALVEEALGYPSQDYSSVALDDTRKYIAKILLQLYNLRPKIKAGSAQETLVLRRIRAFEIVRELMDVPKK